MSTSPRPVLVRSAWRLAPLLALPLLALPLLALPLLTLLPTASANQTHYHEVTLEEVLARSTLILVARRASPATTVELVDITPPGQKKDPAKYPPYRRTVLHFVPQRALHPAGVKGLPRTCAVLPADDGSQLDLHRRYHVEKVSKSPIYAHYESKTSRQADKAAAVILFLAPAPGAAETAVTPPRPGVKPSAPCRMQLVVEGGMEPASEEASIRRALARRRSPPTPPAP